MRTFLPTLAAALLSLAAPAGALAATNTITTIAGDGTAAFRGENVPASGAAISFPYGIAATADGGLLFADSGNHRIRRIAPDGTITTVAGSGRSGDAFGDNGPATGAALTGPTDVAITPDGGFVIADSAGQRIRRVSPGGTISTIAGKGILGANGDNQPATSVELGFPSGVAVTADGSVIFTEAQTNRVRRVDPSGIITTIAGRTTPGLEGDGGPATSALFRAPRDLAVLPDGTILVADTGNGRVRRILRDGTITTFAGGGFNFNPDGVPATSAGLSNPYAISVAPDGSVLIADGQISRVWRVAPNGTMTLFAGTGVMGFAGDGGPARNAQLNFTYGVGALQDGRVVIADSLNHRLRRVDSALLRTCENPSAIVGDDGPNALSGTPGADIICARGGNDTITNVGPGDLVFADGGDDSITTTGDAGAAQILGGSGTDRVSFAARTSRVVATIGASTADADLAGDIEELIGGAGDDELRAASQAVVLRGGPGADLLVGSPQADELQGDGDNDQLYAGDGNDVLRGGTGADVLSAQGDDDRLVAEQDGAQDFYAGEGGVDLVSYESYTAGAAISLDDVANDGAGGENDSVSASVEQVAGSPQGDAISAQPTGATNLLLGNGGNDTIVNLGENDEVRGGDGDDILGAGAGLGRFSGGPGNDRVTFATRTSRVVATVGDAAISSDIEQLTGGAGDDELRSFATSVVLRGGPGNDLLVGSPQADTLRGEAGEDQLYAGDSADVLQGGPGADVLSGQGGDDSLVAEQDGAQDFYAGEGGTDLVSYAAYTAAIDVSLDDGANDGAGGENDSVAASTEQVSGGPSGDTITGSGGANLLVGNGGNDRIDGLGGADQLFGNNGDDTLTATDSPAAADTLDCGAGTDRFAIDLLDTRRGNCEVPTR